MARKNLLLKSQNSKRLKLILHHWAGILLLLLALTLGLSTYKDYGVNWDDPTQREMGQLTYDYATTRDVNKSDYKNKEYGPAYELFLVILEKQLHLQDTRDIYLMRHLVTHLFFLTGAFFLYLLAYRIYKNRFIACICFLMMLFCPRIYAHSFFNTKDIPFLAAVCISLYLCNLALKKRKQYLFILAGIGCGITTDIRIMGMIIFAITLIYVFISVAYGFYKKQNILPDIICITAFCASFCISVYVCFPYLWSAPIANFINSYNVMSHFHWKGNIFQDGKVIPVEQIPWYFFIVWFVVTNPIGWLVLGFAGIGTYIFAFIKAPKEHLLDKGKSLLMLHFLTFLVPIFTVIMLHSVIYEDWRHLFFVYPPFIIMAGYFLNMFYKKLYWKWL